MDSSWVVTTLRLAVGVAVPSLCLSVYLSVCLSICLSVRLSVRPSVRPSVCLSVRPSVRLSVRPSVRLSVCPFVRLSVCPSVRPFVRLYRTCQHNSLKTNEPVFTPVVTICPGRGMKRSTLRGTRSKLKVTRGRRFVQASLSTHVTGSISFSCQNTDIYFITLLD